MRFFQNFVWGNRIRARFRYDEDEGWTVMK